MEKFVRNAHKKQKAAHEEKKKNASEAQKNSIQKRKNTISLKNAECRKKFLFTIQRYTHFKSSCVIDVIFV